MHFKLLPRLKCAVEFDVGIKAKVIRTPQFVKNYLYCFYHCSKLFLKPNSLCQYVDLERIRRHGFNVFFTRQF